jgi:transcriptional regulator with XRE-family HTH domain
MATEQQIDRIKYLRGNGLSQKDIAEDVGLSPQMVSVILKDIASKFNETKPVRVIHAVGFEPKDTVIEFTTRDFENFRESETLYAAEQSVFEVRPGIVHKTTFPDIISVDCYAEIADFLPIVDLPNQLFDKEKLRKHFEKLSSGNLSRLKYKGNFVGAVAKLMYPVLGIDSTRYDQGQFTLIWTELEDMIREYLSKQLNEIQDRFLEEMPSVENTIANVRYHLQNKLTSELVHSGGQSGGFSALETEFLEDMSQDYPFIIDLIWRIHVDSKMLTFDFEEDCEVFMNEMLQQINLSVRDLKHAFEFGTLDKRVIDRYLSTGASSESELQEIEEKGVSNVDELKAAKVAFNNQPINLEDYPSVLKGEGRIPTKIRSAVERGELDDALLHAFTHFETHAKQLWTHPYGTKAKFIPRGWKGRDGEIGKIFDSILANHRHASYIMNAETYSPTEEEFTQIGIFFEPDEVAGVKRKSNLGGRMRMKPLQHQKEKELFCWNLFRVKYNHAMTKGSEPSSEILVNIFCPLLSEDGDLHSFCEQARHIRNDLLHEGDTTMEIITRHVRAMLELTELVILKLENLNAYLK